MPEPIRFLLNGAPIDAHGVAPQTTLLEFLREQRGLTGTKEGCAEGDCGACTVVVAERGDDGLALAPVNACIRLLPSVDGKAVFTVESLAAPTARCIRSSRRWSMPRVAVRLLHARLRDEPVRRSTRRGRRRRATRARRGAVGQSLPLHRLSADPRRRAGDARAAAGGRLARPRRRGDGSRIAAERTLAARSRRSRAPTARIRARRPALVRRRARSTQLAAACARTPGRAHRRRLHRRRSLGHEAASRLGDIVYVGDVARACGASRARRQALDDRRGATLDRRASHALDRRCPELHEAWVRFASPPIRNSGTLGGNVANGSPIGDSMPALIALGARSCCAARAGERDVAARGFLSGLSEDALAPGEFVAAIRIPPRAGDCCCAPTRSASASTRTSPRVFACFALARRRRHRRRRASAAAASRRCRCARDAPRRCWSGSRGRRPRAERAAQMLADEFAPIDDMRATAAYRRAVLGNLLRRFGLETPAREPRRASIGRGHRA